MKSRNDDSKIRRRLMLALLLAVTGVCVTATASNADAAIRPPRGWPKSFTLQYCWGASDPADVGPYCPCADITLNRDKTIDVLDCLTNQFYTNAGNWRKRQRWGRIEFTLSNGVVYEGFQLPDGSYEGTIMAPSGLMGVWVGEFNP